VTDYKPGDRIVVVNLPKHTEPEREVLLNKRGTVIEAELNDGAFIYVNMDNLGSEGVVVNPVLFLTDEIELVRTAKTYKHWSEDYRVEFDERGGFALTHIPSDTELLFTRSVSMETLVGLMREFDTFGQIRDNWREWWAERVERRPEVYSW
jgi:hypothetical protein